MVDTEKFLAEVRQEIARLQGIERALTSNTPKTKTGRGRISEKGRTVISLAAQLRHAEKSKPRNAARVKELREKLKAAKTSAAKG